jgi:hypothetical protein
MAATAAEASTLAAMWAPAAAAASLATLGANVGPAVAAIVATNAVASAMAAVPGFADGVIRLPGPGTGTSDSIPAMLSAGESVITANGTRGNERLLAAINAGAKFDMPTAANDTTGRSASAPPIQINNYGGAKVEAHRNEDGSIKIEIDKWWAKNGDAAVAGKIEDANSKTSGTLHRHVGPRRRAG